MTTEHYIGPIPEEELPRYEDADILKVLDRLAEKHKIYPAEEKENGN
jgi:hypothetical protein